MRAPLSLSRRQLLGSATACLIAPLCPARAADRNYELAPVERAPGVWMIEGAREVFSRQNGGAIVNIALLETPKGAVVIDTGSTGGMGVAIRAFADQRLGGVAMVLNTHHHPDHWFGNAAFEDCPLLAPAPAIAACTQYGGDFAASLYAILGSWMSGTRPLPARQPTAEGPLEVGGRKLVLRQMAGHTLADLVVIDQATGTLIASDMLFLDRAPSLPDADYDRWLAGLDQLARLSPSGTIPGHGPFHRDGAALAQTRAYLTATRARLDLAAQTGLTRIEAMSAGPAPEFAHLGANPEEYIRSVVQRWPDHETAALPVIDGA
jgi:quinoprotein relay system zinc metallohydrolase 1